MTGPEIRDLRLALGESHAKFGKRFGVTRQAILHWEQRGSPSQGSGLSKVEETLDLLRRQADRLRRRAERPNRTADPN